jgi:hypothetical protein
VSYSHFCNIKYSAPPSSWYHSWLVFCPGKAAYSDFFRLTSPLDDQVLCMSAAGEPLLCRHPSQDICAGQYFRFLLEDVQIEGAVEWNLAAGKVLSEASKPLCDSMVTNHTNRADESVVQISKVRLHMGKFEWTQGYISLTEKILKCKPCRSILYNLHY